MQNRATNVPYMILAPDGRRLKLGLSSNLNWEQPVLAPDWLLKQLGLEARFKDRWHLKLLPSSDKSGEPMSALPAAEAITKVCLVRSTTAAAIKAPSDPRQARLRTERLRLEKLNQESDYVRVTPMNVLEGSEPEHYRVTFSCKGIVSINSARQPVYGNLHQVEILCDDDFPSDVPRLRWTTEIWHPNIQHREPKGVCVNKAEWLGGMGLDDLCRLLFEMVQYKNYHAVYAPPYALDQEVAKWVLEFGEPHGIMDKTRKISVDDKPFTRPTVPNFISVSTTSPPVVGRIKLVPAANTTTPALSRIKLVNSASNEGTSDAPPSAGGRIKIVKKE